MDLLIVDDDCDFSDMLSDVLAEEGHQIRLARNGREGLESIRAHLPALILLDVEMPTLTGPEMAYQLFLANAANAKIPIVLTSAVTDLAQVARAIGTPYFLAKPYRLDAVLAMVERALAERTPPRPLSSPGVHAHHH
jgi:DNA-binding NtrC family response regulator